MIDYMHIKTKLHKGEYTKKYRAGKFIKAVISVLIDDRNIDLIFDHYFAHKALHWSGINNEYNYKEFYDADASSWTFRCDDMDKYSIMESLSVDDIKSISQIKNITLFYEKTVGNSEHTMEAIDFGELSFSGRDEAGKFEIVVSNRKLQKMMNNYNINIFPDNSEDSDFFVIRR